MIHPFMFCIATTAILLMAPAGRAADLPNTSDKDMTHEARFSAEGDNFVLFFNQMNNKGWSTRDEPAIRAHYSLRYLLQGRASYHLFLAYSGEFDFYAGTRPSGPVINRLNNPGLIVRTKPDRLTAATGRETDYLEIGLQHESDGQVQEVSDGRGTESARLAYAEKNRHFFDQISRGSDFVSLSVHFADVGQTIPISLDIGTRWYLEQDYAVTWGPRASEGLKLSDFNRVRVHARTRGEKWQFSAGWTVGDMGLKTDSLDLGLVWNLKTNALARYFGDISLPVYLRYHRGPLNTLSNYSQRQDSWGFGLDFSVR